MKQSNTVTRSLTRRGLLLGAGAIALSPGVVPMLAIASPVGSMRLTSSSGGDEIRPFRAEIAQSELDGLRNRIIATRWPSSETVADRTQGSQLAKMKELADYWAHRYDWRKAERKLNAFPQFMTRIDGVDVHFIHVKSKHTDALPLIITHGWPGSVFELLNTIAPLTDPTSHGGTAADAFHLVIPSVPGFGFSSIPTEEGWNPARIATTWNILMNRLGYDSYVAQGGDWGAIICDALGRIAPGGLRGIHVNRVERGTTFPPDVSKALRNGDPAPKHLNEEQMDVFNQARDFLNNGFGYAAIMGTRPQTIGYGLSDSPMGLAAWAYDKFADWVFTRGDPEASFTRDELLDNITLYWLTNTGSSSSRIYWENSVAAKQTKPITVPTGVTVFPGEVYKPPKEWAMRAYPNLIYYNKVAVGGHFAALEEPDAFAKEVRAAFRSLR
ncbi:epoxide hydrolase family protein [Ensifer adhaerens]|uniref:epoxide hydrolase family protein n=1 Tax=Ensifer adhaerens TaxID=106592 RepID=UPI00132F09F0|nr:epoxide hydrolase family protein [Ensifer adhaerens]QHG74960.1 epoxide hydrolase [Ensifer adhaerens]